MLMVIGNNNVIGGYIGNTAITKVYIGNELVYTSESPQPTGYTDMYLTFRITDDGDININDSQEIPALNLFYKLNNGSWEYISDSDIIEVVSGDTIQFYGDNRFESLGYLFSDSTAGFIAEGNIMSLISDLGFTDFTDLTDFHDYLFADLFLNCTGLTDASNLILQATTLYDGCYKEMFQGCTNLEIAPELPAPTLAYESYNRMFAGCSNLRYVKCLATTFADESIGNWMEGVANDWDSVFIVANGMHNWKRVDTCDDICDSSGIPNNWQATYENGDEYCDAYCECQQEDCMYWDEYSEECVPDSECFCQQLGLCFDWDSGDCVECDGDPEQECYDNGGCWDSEMGECVECGGDPEQECYDNGGCWDGSECVECDDGDTEEGDDEPDLL